MSAIDIHLILSELVAKETAALHKTMQSQSEEIATLSKKIEEMAAAHLEMMAKFTELHGTAMATVDKIVADPPPNVPQVQPAAVDPHANLRAKYEKMFIFGGGSITFAKFAEKGFGAHYNFPCPRDRASKEANCRQYLAEIQLFMPQVRRTGEKIYGVTARA